MKFYEAFNFQNLYQKLKNEPLPIKLAYKLNKINLLVQNEIIFYEDSLKKIIEQYAQKDSNGNYIQNETHDGIIIQQEYLEVCHKQINELQYLEFDIPNISFTLEELDGLKMTPVELSCIFSLITE